jgi:thiamine kinase-like enzyme
MDAQSLNLLKAIDSASSPLKMIDYEYSSRNPRVFDIANTFCEYADMNHMTADFAVDYPNEETQDLFLQSYLSDCAHAGDTPEESPTSPLYALSPIQKAEFFATLRRMIGRASLVSHLGWAVWALVQDSIAHIAFDYEQYARHRMEGYRYNKKTYWT